MKKLSFETIGSISAIVVGVAALFITWEEARIMRNQQHGGVLPLLSPDFSVSVKEGSLVLALAVSNEGVGPALVESIYVTIDGERIDSGADFMRRLFGDSRPSGSASIVGSDLEMGVLGAGDEVSLFTAAWPATPENVEAFQVLGERYVNNDGPVVSLTSCYCSVFGRCYESAGRDRPRRVQACPAPTNMFSQLLHDEKVSQQ